MNIIEDMLKHKDEEVIAYLAKVMQGVVKNYNLSLEKNQPEILWGNLGDLTMVSQVLKAMDKRTQEKLAQIQSQL